MLLWYYGDKCGQGATKGLLETLYFGNDGGGGEKQRGKGRGAKEQVLVESGLRMGLCCGLRGCCAHGVGLCHVLGHPGPVPWAGTRSVHGWI